MPTPPPTNVALIGQRFMGRAHSNAFQQAPRFFRLRREPVLHTVCGRDRESLAEFAAQWGWRSHSTGWRVAVRNEEIDLVDVATPNHLHAQISIAAIEAGHAVACEKPLARTLSEAKEMADAARRGKAKTFVWYNYRRCPAVALAHQLVKKRRLGRIYHVRAAYLQDWGGPKTPLLWRFQKKFAGSGAHGDLNAHLIDMARFITGQEIVEVSGAISETFISRRPTPGNSRRKGRSDVDDALLFLARFEGGAVGSFESSRLATGHKNANQIEINGERGSLKFDFERMNELLYFDASQDPAVAGWTNVLATESGDHPYAAAWWPPGHIIGYEHSFINMAADILNAMGGAKPIVPLPDFLDALKTQAVLEAAVISARKKSPIKIKDLL
jgi:predicted dehydrogenase